MPVNRHILPIIVIAQFLCTSLWFAGNAVIGDLISSFRLNETALTGITIAVQLGFIAGTLVFALFTVADRYSPSLVFMVSALLGAVFNLGCLWQGNSLESLLSFRFITGFCLAGVYPVGMKIASDYYREGLGTALGYLVGALVLGTALPHFIKAFTTGLPWKIVLILVSLLSVVGGLLIYFFVPDGPYRKSAGGKPDFLASFRVFRQPLFRQAAFGYFGHMWELYTFWAFVPVLLLAYNGKHPDTSLNISLWSFLIIGVGSLSCITGGYISKYKGSRLVAYTSLALSGICCLVSGFMLQTDVAALFISFLMIWGIFVIPDSPMFSSLVAQSALPEYKGVALTMVNCIGFFITIISIRFTGFMFETTDIKWVFPMLAIGPVLGNLSALLGKKKIS